MHYNLAFTGCTQEQAEEQAAAILVNEENATQEQAFLAVKAAKILLNDDG
jgi:hypothetical protein